MYAIAIAAIGVIGYLALQLPPDSQPVVPQDIASTIHQIQQGVVATGQTLLQAVDDTVLTLTRAVFVTLLVLCFFLYFTHLHRRRKGPHGGRRRARRDLPVRDPGLSQDLTAYLRSAMIPPKEETCFPNSREESTR